MLTLNFVGSDPKPTSWTDLGTLKRTSDRRREILKTAEWIELSLFLPNAESYPKDDPWIWLK